MPERVAATAKAPEAKQTCSNSCKQNVGFNSSGSTADRIIQLQRTAGNQAVQRLIKSGALQAKLRIGQPNDIYEQEADRVAEQVLRMPEQGIQRQPVEKTLASEITPLVQRDIGKEGEKEDIFRAKESGKSSPEPGFQNRLTQLKGGGNPLPEPTQKSMKSRFGASFSAVRVHSGSEAAGLAREINARAFTSGKDIYFGENQFRPGTESGDRLLAHEMTHVIQQRGDSSRPVSRVQMSSDAENVMIARKDAALPAKTDSKTASAAAGDTALGVVELKGVSEFEPPEPILNYFNERQTGNVQVRFGKLAEGIIEVKKSKRSKNDSGSYIIENQAIPLKHPIFAGLDSGPNLIINTNKDLINGYVSFGEKGGSGALFKQLEKTPNLIGLPGFDLLGRGTFSNKLENGALELGLEGAPINLGGAFSGNVTLKAINENVAFSGNASINVTGLGSGNLVLSRSEEGLVKGEAKVGVQLKKNVSGEVMVVWTGGAIEGEGKVGYQGEKLSGNVLLKVMEKQEAERLAIEKKAPSGGESPGKSAVKIKNKHTKLHYAVFGEGDLTFSFNEWLNGNAHTVVDQNGFVTVIGKITPQKEFELFPQKDYNKDLFKLEARAAYGIPVVGNIFIFANVGMGAFAKLGPAKFYNIIVDGTYSTDPKSNNDFSIRGSLNISAAAGLKLRGEAGAGLEALAHDIKAGAGINGLAGINGYAEATPTIGYREKGKDGEDKKGEFFIRGELEIAAQPFLGLSGDLFVEVDAPVWSPVPDKKWMWSLFGKEWPLGGSLGIGASVDYVFGSGQVPEIEFKKVDFSADKFLTDLYSDKAQPKSGEKGPQKGGWAEKNSKGAEPPSKSAKKGNAQPGKAAELPPAKSKVQPGGAKKSKKDIDPNARTKDGKTAKQHQDEAAKKGKKPEGKEQKKGTGKEEPVAKDQKEKVHDEQLQKGLAALNEVTKRYEKDGATKEEIEIGVKAVRRKFKVFKSITIVESNGIWRYHYIASEGEAKGPKIKDEKKRVLRAYHGANGDKILGIIKSKKMNPNQGKIYLAKNDFDQALMHGGDRSRKANFVIEVELTFDFKKVREQFESTKGVQSTKLLTTAYPVEAKVLKLFIRKPDGEGGFVFDEISGEQEIINYLVKKQDKDKKESKEPKGKGEGKGKEKKEHDEQLKEGLAALDAVTKRYAKDGATKEEVETGVKAVRRKFKVFKSIIVEENKGKGTWKYHYVASDGDEEGPKIKHVDIPPNISDTWKKVYENGIPDLTNFMNPTGQLFKIDFNYGPDGKGRNNRQRMKDGVGPIFPSGDTIELHHEKNNFFGVLHEKSAKYHKDLHDDPDTHPLTGDPAYDSWRKCYGYYNGNLITLDKIFNRIRQKYWIARAKGQ